MVRIGKKKIFESKIKIEENKMKKDVIKTERYALLLRSFPKQE
jgi:hypothetical protein